LLELAQNEDIIEINCDLEIRLKNGSVYKIFEGGFVLKGHEHLMNEPVQENESSDGE